jgi:hypothetical protein
MTSLPVVPDNDASPPVHSLTPSARLMGLYILAASRTGKSRLLGRGIVWSDYYWEIPQIVIDATGNSMCQNRRISGCCTESNTSTWHHLTSRAISHTLPDGF